MLGALVGDTLGCVDGGNVALADIGAKEGTTEGEMLGFTVFGDLVGFEVGLLEGAHVGTCVVGNTVGAAVLGELWHIDGESAVHKPLYILPGVPEIAAQSLPVATTG